ncbi:T9SS type A sorting domain-containing protein [bacterium]|nr:T9SS type A sorting domain-containing protein [bacterium]
MRYQLFDNYGIPMFDSPPLLASEYSDGWGDMLECHTDDDGGCFAVWRYADTVDSLWYIMAQHFDQNGNRTWGESGMIIHTLDPPFWSGYQDWSISPDGVGGLLCAFGFDNVIYLTRIDQNGSHVWGEEEVLICDAQNIRNDLAITHDGQGGAYLAWRDLRPPFGFGSTFMQYVNSEGVVQWQPNGVLMWNYSPWIVQVIPDSEGGVLLHTGAGTYNHVFRVNSQGETLWHITGYSWGEPAHIVEGENGYFYLVTFNDDWRAVYAQMLDCNGQAYWGEERFGVLLAGVGMGQIRLFWDFGSCYQDARLYVCYEVRDDNLQNSRVYSQCIDTTGQTLWGGDWGLYTAYHPNFFEDMFPIPDNQGGIYLLLWRSGGPPNIQGKHVNANGTLGGLKPAMIEQPSYPKIESTGSNSLSFTLPTASQVTIDLFNILGQQVQTISEGFRQAGSYSIRLDERNLASGVYLARLQAGASGSGAIPTTEVVKIAVVR